MSTPRPLPLPRFPKPAERMERNAFEFRRAPLCVPEKLAAQQAK